MTRKSVPIVWEGNHARLNFNDWGARSDIDILMPSPFRRKVDRREMPMRRGSDGRTPVVVFVGV